MQLSLSVDITAEPKKIWGVISDIENCAGTISGIEKIEILEKAKGPSIVGLKWRETRKFMGKEATEVMWITDAKEQEFYETRAENHGSIYQTHISLTPVDGTTRLTMSFEGSPQTTGAKILWFLTGWMAKGPMRKAINADLADIKKAAEAE